MSELRRAWQTFWLAAATIFMVSLDVTVVTAAFPSLRAAFIDTSVAGLSWVINGYTIVFAALLVPFGRVVDEVGPRRCFLLSTLTFTIASTACGFAPSPEWLTAARVLQAIAAAMISPASLALIINAFPTEQRSRLAGLWSAAGALAASSGPAIGSVLIEWFSWRMIFLINLPIGLAVFFLARQNLSRDPALRARPGFDAVGTMLILLGVGGISSGLSQAGESSLASTAVLAPLGLGLITSACFVYWARQRSDSTLDLRLFSDPRYRWASLATLVLGMAFGMMFLAFYLLFIGVWHYSQAVAGLAATPGPLLAALIAIGLSSRLRRYGFYLPLLLGSLIFSISNLWLALGLEAEPAYLAIWLPAQLLGGIAIGLMLPSITAAAVSHLPQEQIGVGGAVNSAVRLLGSTFGVALAVAMLDSDSFEIEPYRLIYGSLALCGCIIAIFSFGIRFPARFFEITH